MLRSKIQAMLEKRDYPKTCCPSEIARALTAEELHQLGCEDWRAAMPVVREEAWKMRAEGALDVTQKGEAVSAEGLDQIKGPIRLRSKPVEP